MSRWQTVKWQTVKHVGQTVYHWKTWRNGTITDISKNHKWILIRFSGKHSPLMGGQWPVLEWRRSEAFE